MLAQTSGDGRLDRLEILADIWGKVYLFHPNIVTRAIDFDACMAKAIPRMERAGTPEQVVSTLNDELFTPLGDFGLFAQPRAGIPAAVPRPVKATLLSSSIGLVDATDPQQYLKPDFLQVLSQQVNDLGSIQRLVVDLRWESPLNNRNAMGWLQAFLERPVVIGGLLFRSRIGWSEQRTAPYDQLWVTSPASTIKPIESKIALPVLFVVNNESYLALERTLDGLRAGSGAKIIWEQSGSFGEPSIRGYPGFEISFQAVQLLSQSGGLHLQADYTTREAISQWRLSQLAEELFLRQTAPRQPFGFEMRLPERPAPSLEPLSREQRIFGLIKIWTKYFSPHLEHASVPWAGILKAWIPRIEAAETLRDYYDELSQLMAILHDGHAGVYHPILYPEDHVLGVKLAKIGNKVVVVGTRKDPRGESSIRIGDEVLAIDGKSIADIDQHWRQRLSASTEAGLQRRIWAQYSRGGADSSVRLTIKREGEPRNVLLTRFAFRPADATQRACAGEACRDYQLSVPFQQLPNDLGYLNLYTLPDAAALDRAYRQLHNNKGLILDLRGYPGRLFGGGLGGSRGWYR
jgi:hypothetical protein